MHIAHLITDIILYYRYYVYTIQPYGKVVGIMYIILSYYRYLLFIYKLLCAVTQLFKVQLILRKIFHRTLFLRE